MRKNLKLFLFIIVAMIVLYLTKINYSDHSLNKSISACIIAQKKIKNSNYEDAKKYCEDEINKKINK